MVRRSQLGKLTAVTLAAILLVTTLPARATEVTFDKTCLKEKWFNKRLYALPEQEESYTDALERTLLTFRYWHDFIQKIAESNFKAINKLQSLKLGIEFISAKEINQAEAILIGVRLRRTHYGLHPYPKSSEVKLVIDSVVTSIKEQERINRMVDDTYNSWKNDYTFRPIYCEFYKDEKTKKLLLLVIPADQIAGNSFSSHQCIMAQYLKLYCVKIDMNDTKDTLLSVRKSFGPLGLIQGKLESDVENLIYKTLSLTE